MNLAEKLAAIYLRLNGFLFLDQFTVFTGGQHNHIDLVGLRAANSEEVVDQTTLPVDEKLFSVLTEIRGECAKTTTVGIAAEVRTNTNRDLPCSEHLSYATRFLGGTRVTPMAFFDGQHQVRRSGEAIDVSLSHAGDWLVERFEKMDHPGFNLTKEGSWNLSEPFLAELLCLRKLGMLSNPRGETRGASR
jgi:hypothetical protein